LAAVADHRPPASRRRALSRRSRESLVSHVTLGLFAIAALLPFASIALIALYPTGQAAEGLALPNSIDLGNFARAWDTANLGTLLRSSAIVAGVVVPVGTALSILTGYAFGTMRFRARGPLFYVFLIGLVMPFEATVVPLYYDLRSVGLTDSYLGLILPETALYLSFGTFWMRAAFLSAPTGLIEAARVDGASSWTILWRVIVPGLRPQITTLMVLFFMWSWNEFLLALVLLQDPSVQTAPAGLGIFIGEHIVDESGLAAAALTVTVPVLVVYVFLQRHFIRGVLAGSLKG
jgi:raffinose/stachyose/melibiose transport system permease protein